MSRVFAFLVTVVLFAGFVLLTLPLAVGEWAFRLDLPPLPRHDARSPAPRGRV
jgi:hypothetical protein